MSHSADPIPAPQSGLPNPVQPQPVRTPDLRGAAKPRRGTEADEAHPANQKRDYDRGAEAGKDKKPGETPESSEENPSKSFEHGYLDAQKVRSDKKPPR